MHLILFIIIFLGPTKKISCVRFSSECMFVSSSDGHLWQWDLEPARCVTKVTGMLAHTRTLCTRTLYFTYHTLSTYECMFVSSSDGHLWQWDLEPLLCLLTRTHTRSLSISYGDMIIIYTYPLIHCHTFSSFLSVTGAHH